MSKKQSTYRLLSSFLMILTTLLLVVQVVFAVFNAQKVHHPTSKNKSQVVELKSEAVLPVVVLPFCKAVFAILVGLTFLALACDTIASRSKESLLIFNVKNLGSVCMNGP